MHELSVARSLLEMVQTKADEAGARLVTKLTLEIGEMSCIDDENLRFVFDVLKKKTIAGSAQMVIRRIPVEAVCEVCGQNIVVEEYRFLCDRCGSKRVNIVKGNEMNLVSLEVE